MREPMRPLLLILPLVGLLACQSTTRVATTDARPSGGSTATPPPPPPPTAAPATPPPRPTTKAGCDACKGQWARHGIAEGESCICKTNDEGHDCRDGNECQGECLLADDAVFHVMDQGDPPRGYYEGRCASYDTTFGCFRHVPADIGSQLPLTPEEAGPFVCVD